MPSDLLDDTAESAVRNYLLFLDDPRKLIDHGLIETLRNKAEQADDPIERLKVYAELERAQQSDDSRYKLDFILHAKSWADANNVNAAAFRHFGVKDDVLRSAGLVSEVVRRRKKTRVSEQPSVRGSVTAETIKSHIRSLHGRFTLADVQSSV